VQSLLPKQKVPDHGKFQHKNHSHSKTCLYMTIIRHTIRPVLAGIVPV